MAEIKDWDVAAASNNGTPPDGAPEGMAPSAVNDVIRENMAVLARWKGDNDGSLDTTGSSNTYALAANGTYSAYTRGDTFTFEANHTNTGAATLNVSSLGAKAIKHVSGAALIANQIQSGGVYRVVYDGTNFLLQNPSMIDSSGVLDHAGDAQFGGADGKLAIQSTSVTLDGSDSTTPVDVPIDISRSAGIAMFAVGGNNERAVFAYAKEGDFSTGAVGDLVQDDAGILVVACGATNLTVATASSGREGETVNAVVLRMRSVT